MELKKQFIDNKNGIEYVKNGDYYLPNLKLPSNITNFPIRKYGRMKLKYLKENNKIEYTNLLLESKLNRYLHEIDLSCEERLNTIISQFVNQENITEELKINNQMEWVGRMNNIKNRAEEIILSELIYV